MLKGMEQLIRQENMLPRGSRVLCAVSGGADSVCLLGALYHLRERLGITLLCAHYNHNLRGDESNRDEDFVRELVKNRFPGVELLVGSGDVTHRAKELRAGVEETARQMRYAFLQEVAHREGADRIATAHTANDNAETILLHLARGTGLQGLTGIAPVRGNLIRPLLTTTRQEVEEFLRTEGIPWVEDSTNADLNFSRNRVRRAVIPELEKLYPGFARRVSENAVFLREDEAYLSAQAAELSERSEWRGTELTISAELLAQAHRPIAVRAVRQLLARLRDGDDTCSAAHLEAVLELCASEDPSGEVHLPGMIARREYGLLCLEPPRQNTPLVFTRISDGATRAGDWEIFSESCTYEGQKQGKLEFWLRDEELALRPRQTGDELKLPDRPGKSVKKWLVEEKIPRRYRENLPVFTDGGRLCAVAGLGADERFLPALGEKARHLKLIPPGEKRDEKGMQLHADE